MGATTRSSGLGVTDHRSVAASAEPTAAGHAAYRKGQKHNDSSEQDCADRPLPEDVETAPRHQQRPSEMLLHHRPEDEAEQERSRRITKLVHEEADEAEQDDQIDVEDLVVDGIDANADEEEH